MAKSKQTFGKKEKEKKRLKKQQEKLLKREERKANTEEGAGDLENMLAYVDENGNIVDTPPDPAKKKKVDIKKIELGVPKREEEDPIKQGKLDFYNDEKGYGFIKENGTNEKYFVHMSNFEHDIVENDNVSFELERGEKGMNAVRVKKV